MSNDESTQPDLCPWCAKDVCEWFIGLPCANSGHLGHFHTPEQKEAFDKRALNADDEYLDADDDECDHCPCYWDYIDGNHDDNNDGVCCDCGKQA